MSRVPGTTAKSARVRGRAMTGPKEPGAAPAFSSSTEPRVNPVSQGSTGFTVTKVPPSLNRKQSGNAENQ